MAAIPPSAAPFAQGEDSSRLRDVVDRATNEVKDCNLQYEDRRQLVDALGATQANPENKSSLDVLALRERRNDAALIKVANAIANLTNFCIAKMSSALHAHAATGAVAITTTATIFPTTPESTTTTNVSDKKLMKRKLPESHDG